jgi:hypothetical protein
MASHIDPRYLAGFFDGEGCIFYNKRPYCRRRYVSVKVTQCESNEQVGNVLHEVHAYLLRHGIKAHLTKHKAGKRSKQGHYTVVASSAPACVAWIRLMLPFLLVKHRAAVDTLKFLETIEHPWTTAAQGDEVEQRRSRGQSIKIIGKAMGLSHGTAKRILTKRGIYHPLPRPVLGHDPSGRFVKTA